jgi:hypothetical protein
LRFYRRSLSFRVIISQTQPLPRCYVRWLLMAHDRLGSDRLPLTLKFLSVMLTVRHASVSEATSALQRAGLI